jgi:hypothetical protein
VPVLVSLVERPTSSHLIPVPPTMARILDEDQAFIFNLGEGNFQPGMSLSEEERIRKLDKEIKEVQNLKTIIFNELEVGARKRAEVDEVKQRFEEVQLSRQCMDSRCETVGRLVG